MPRRIAARKSPSTSSYSKDHPKVMFDPDDGLGHEVYFFDAVFWRPPCSIEPRYKPKGWKKQGNVVITCLQCLVGDERWK